MSQALGWLLVGVILVVLPWTGAWAYRRLKDGRLGRVRAYRSAILFEALYVLGALLYAASTGAVGKVLPIFTRLPPLIAGLTPDRWGGVVVGALVGLLVPMVVPRFRRRLAEAGGDVLALLPRTSSERWLFAAVAISAGIGEELLFRGFLWHFLTTRVPALGVGGSCALAVLLFGLGHVYQGVKGVLATSLMGGMLLAIFLVTGSLLPGIVLHALVDLRAVWILPAQRSPLPSGPTVLT
jgi:membrane protease YdiL (CAAX protease family)